MKSICYHWRKAKTWLSQKYRKYIKPVLKDIVLDILLQLLENNRELVYKIYVYLFPEEDIHKKNKKK